jgi:hypothetical protein
MLSDARDFDLSAGVATHQAAEQLMKKAPSDRRKCWQPQRMGSRLTVEEMPSEFPQSYDVLPTSLT